MKIIFVTVFLLVAARSAPSSQRVNNTIIARMAFNQLDSNNDTFLSKLEFASSFMRFDDNENGKIEKSELLTNYPAATTSSIETSTYVFYLIDTNEDGILDRAELDAQHDRYNRNGDGQVSFAEFAADMGTLQEQISNFQRYEEKLAVAFNISDSNGDGKLTERELKNLYFLADSNKDGKLSRSEFIARSNSRIGTSYNTAFLMFRFLDSDNDGFYGSRRDRAAVMAFFDGNKDGFVALNEFIDRMIYAGAKIQRLLNA